MSLQWAPVDTVFRSRTHNVESWIVVVYLLMQALRKRDEWLPLATLEKLQLRMFLAEQARILPGLRTYYSQYIWKHHHTWIREAEEELIGKDLRSRGMGEARILSRLVMGLGQYFWGNVYTAFAPSRHGLVEYCVSYPHSQTLYRSSVIRLFDISPPVPRGLYPHQLAILNLPPDNNKPANRITTRELFVLVTLATTCMRNCKDMRQRWFMSRIVCFRGTWARVLTANFRRDLLHSMFFRLQDLGGQGNVLLGAWIDIIGENGREEVLTWIFRSIPGYTAPTTDNDQEEYAGSGGNLVEVDDQEAIENMVRPSQDSAEELQEGRRSEGEEQSIAEIDTAEASVVLKGDQGWIPAVENAVDETEFEIDEVAVRKRQAHLARSRRLN